MPKERLELSRGVASADFESAASTDSATQAKQGADYNELAGRGVGFVYGLLIIGAATAVLAYNRRFDATFRFQLFTAAGVDRAAAARAARRVSAAVSGAGR